MSPLCIYETTQVHKNLIPATALYYTFNHNDCKYMLWSPLSAEKPPSIFYYTNMKLTFPIILHILWYILHTYVRNIPRTHSEILFR